MPLTFTYSVNNGKSRDPTSYIKVCPGEMSQNFAVLEPVSQAIYSASFDLDIQIPLSASLIYRDTGYCQKYTVTVAQEKFWKLWSLLCSVDESVFDSNKKLYLRVSILVLSMNGLFHLERTKLTLARKLILKRINFRFRRDQVGIR